MSILFLKLIGILSMICDHVGLVYGLEGFRIIGRVGYPLFAFGIANGWVHTHDKRGYVRRICMIAVLSQPLFSIMTALPVTNLDSGFSFAPAGYWAAGVFLLLLLGILLRLWKDPLLYLAGLMVVFGGLRWQLPVNGQVIRVFGLSTNVMYTFAIALLCLYAFDCIKKDSETHETNKLRRFFVVMLAACVFVLYGAFCDYMYFGAMLVFCFYLVMKKRGWCRMGVAVVWAFLMYGIGTGTFGYVLGSLAAASLLWCYDSSYGGGSKRFRRSLYLLYPVHMLVLICVYLIGL